MASRSRSNGHYDPEEPLQSLTNGDFSDAALMHVFDDTLDTDGTTTSGDIAAALELETKHPRQNVGIRLAYLARHGVVQQNADRRWQWTAAGHRMFKASLTHGQQRALDNVSNEALLQVMHGVGSRLSDLGLTERALLRREWTHSYDGTRR